MMKHKFWTYIKTDKYNIGLTSITIYIYDKQGNEIIKFKDLNYDILDAYQIIKIYWQLKALKEKLHYGFLQKLLR